MQKCKSFKIKTNKQIKKKNGQVKLWKKYKKIEGGHGKRP